MQLFLHTMQLKSTKTLLDKLSQTKSLFQKSICTSYPELQNSCCRRYLGFPYCEASAVIPLGLPTFCFAIPGHLNTGASNFFKPRGQFGSSKILAGQTKETARFLSKIVVISKKKGPHLKSASESPAFVPKS